jgi:hypothetical protein
MIYFCLQSNGINFEKEILKMYIEILDKASAIAAYINGNMDSKEIKFIDLSNDTMYTVDGYALTAVADKDVFALRVTETKPETKKNWFHIK